MLEVRVGGRVSYRRPRYSPLAEPAPAAPEITNTGGETPKPKR